MAKETKKKLWPCRGFHNVKPKNLNNFTVVMIIVLAALKLLETLFMTLNLMSLQVIIHLPKHCNKDGTVQTSSHSTH